MRRILIALALACATLASIANAQSSRATTTKPRYFIFLVHGIGGGEGTFPNMPQALEKHLGFLDPSRTYLVKPVNYSTGDNAKTTLEFAIDVSQKISSHFKSIGGIRETDQISFIAHSQGGLVVSQLLFFTFARGPNFLNFSTDHFDAFITLGTPFWGSKSASLGLMTRKIGKTLSQVRTNSFISWVGTKIYGGLKNFGDAELNDMVFSSNKVNDFFNGAVLINENPTNPVCKIAQQVRVLNVAGYIPEYEYKNGFLRKPLNGISTGLDSIESDHSVMVPAARSDFLYVKANGNYEQYEEVNGYRFKETNMAQFAVVPALHVNHQFPNPMTELGVRFFRSIKGIAQIENECIENLDCGHPSLKLIVNHILENKIDADSTYLRDMTAFLVSFNVTLPEKYNLPTSDLKFEWYMADPEIQIDRTWELGSRGSAKILEQKRSSLIYSDSDLPEASRFRRYYFTGGVRGSFDPNLEKKFKKKYLSVRIKALGLKTRQIEIPVRASYTTFIDVNMDADGGPTKDQLLEGAYKRMATTPLH